MSKLKRGFTLIEVALFLAVTAALFVGVTVGVQNSIYQQRYNDSVQNFVEFLRRVYSGVANVQSLGNGRSEQAIYGKLVTFGESRDLAGQEINGVGQRDAIFVYDVIGKIGNISSGDTLTALEDLNASVTEEKDGRIVPVGVVESYTPRWTAQIEPTDSYEPFKGMLLVVRHPRSGTIYTFHANDVIEVNKLIGKMNVDLASGLEINNKNVFTSDGHSGINAWGFNSGEVDFCINPIGDEETRERRDVRIKANARNASAIEIMPSDSENNKCRRD